MESFYLNKTWKLILFVNALIGTIAVPILVLLVIILQISNLLLIGLLVLATLSIFELIYEALYTRIEFSDVGIFYYQPRFTLQFNWMNIQKIEISIYGVVLIFSEAQTLNGHWLVNILKLTGPWERTIPYCCYIAPENIDKIKKILSNYASNLNTDSIMLLNNHFKKP